MKKLVEAGVAVYVDNVTSFMTHDKYVIVDNRVVMEGSVNMTGKALMSSGKMMVMDDMRAVRLIMEDFTQALGTARLVSREEVTSCIVCPDCA